MDEWSKVLSDKLRRRSCHCPSKKKIRSKMKWKYSEIDQITKSRERERRTKVWTARCQTNSRDKINTTIVVFRYQRPLSMAEAKKEEHVTNIRDTMTVASETQ
jgi:hypothetical protein